MRWTSRDREQGKVCPLVAKHLKANLLRKDILRQMDAVVTTDHRAFYEDISDEKEAQRQE